MVALQKHDRLPMPSLKARVDALRFGADFLQKLLVAWNIRAAWSADLHKGKGLLVGGIQFQEALNPVKTLQDALGVIDAVDANSQKRCFDAKFGAERGAFCARIDGPVRRVAARGSGNADRIRPHPRDVPLPIYRKTI